MESLSQEILRVLNDANLLDRTAEQSGRLDILSRTGSFQAAAFVNPPDGFKFFGRNELEWPRWSPTDRPVLLKCHGAFEGTAYVLHSTEGRSFAILPMVAHRGSDWNGGAVRLRPHAFSIEERLPSAWSTTRPENGKLSDNTLVLSGWVQLTSKPPEALRPEAEAIHAASSAVSTLTRAIANCQAAVDYRSGRAVILKGRLERAQGQLVTLPQRIEKLTRRVEHLDRMSTKANGGISSALTYTAEAATGRHLINASEDELDALPDRIAALEAELAEMESPVEMPAELENFLGAS